jgi:hypothetical protein
MSSTTGIATLSSTGGNSPGSYTNTAVVTVTNAPASFTISPVGGDITLSGSNPQGTVSVVKVS